MSSQHAAGAPRSSWISARMGLAVGVIGLGLVVLAIFGLDWVSALGVFHLDFAQFHTMSRGGEVTDPTSFVMKLYFGFGAYAFVGIGALGVLGASAFSPQRKTFTFLGALGGVLGAVGAFWFVLALHKAMSAVASSALSGDASTSDSLEGLGAMTVSIGIGACVAIVGFLLIAAACSIMSMSPASAPVPSSMPNYADGASASTWPANFGTRPQYGYPTGYPAVPPRYQAYPPAAPSQPYPPIPTRDAGSEQA